MMDRFAYIPASTGTPLNMDGGASFVGTAKGVRSRSWSYELGYRDLVSANRPAREVEITLHTDFDAANDLRRAADADVAARTPGTFVAEGEWKQRGYIVESMPDYIAWGKLGTKLKALLVDGAWWRLQTREFAIPDAEGEYTFLDYAYDYPYDYTPNLANTSVETSVLTPCDVHLVIYGAAVNPYVIIGGNTYQVNVTVPAGGYLTVDGREKTIELTLADGTVQNAFAYGVRGSGQGGGSYIFEPIQAGEQDVQWLGTFGFDLGWYEEEGEPPWIL